MRNTTIEAFLSIMGIATMFSMHIATAFIKKNTMTAMKTVEMCVPVSCPHEQTSVQ
jgi:hypothetical protein